MKKKDLEKKWRKVFSAIVAATVITTSVVPESLVFASAVEEAQDFGDSESMGFVSGQEELIEGDSEENNQSASDISMENPDNVENVADGFTDDVESFDTEGETPVENGFQSQATVEELQQRINALPTVEEFQEMADGTTVEDSTLNEKQMDVYYEVQAIADKMEMLSEEEQGQLDTSKLEALSAYFNSMTEYTEIQGSGTKDDPYILSNTAEFVQTFEKNKNGRYYKLSDDFDDTTPVTEPMEPLSGTLDGNGQTVKVAIRGSYTENVGLFKYVDADGKIANLTVEGYVENTNTASENGVGGICGGLDGEGMISGCTNKATVNGNAYVGGICGYVGFNTGFSGWSSNRGIVSDCANEGTISGKKYVGGICGSNSGKVQGCTNKGTVTAENLYAGGIAGRTGNYRNSATVENCTSSGNVTCNTYKSYTGYNDSQMAYKKDGNGYHVIGKIGNEWRQIHKENDVFQIKVSNRDNVDLSVSLGKPEIVSDGKLLKFTVNISNPTSSYAYVTNVNLYGATEYGGCITTSNKTNEKKEIVAMSFNGTTFFAYSNDGGWIVNTDINNYRDTEAKQVNEKCDSAYSTRWYIQELKPNETVTRTLYMGVMEGEDPSEEVLNQIVHPHYHDWKYSVTGGTVEVYCASEDCPSGTSEANKACLLLSARNKIYDGKAYAGAEIWENTITKATGEQPSSIVYAGRNGTTYAESETPPTERGNYTAKVTIGGQTAVAYFSITKKQYSASLTMTGWEYGSYDPQKNKPEWGEGSKPDEITYTYYVDRECQIETTPENSGAAAPGEIPADAGRYYVKTTAEETQDYEKTDFIADFEVTQKEVKVTENTKAKDKYYDGTCRAELEPVTVETGIAGQSLIISGNGSFSDKNAGENKTVIVGQVWATAVDASTTKASNYRISYPETVKADINPLPVKLKWSNTDLIYKGETLNVTAEVENAVTGDRFTIKYTGNTGENVGSEYEAAVTELGNPNYTLDGSTGNSMKWSIHYPNMEGKDAVISGDANENGWCKSSVRIEAPTGYQISTDGINWSDSCVFEEQGTQEVTYQLKERKTGYISAPQTTVIKIDTQEPTGEIVIGNMKFSESPDTITYGNWLKNTDQVSVGITGADEVSGIEKIEYQLIGEKDSYDENGNWETLNKDGRISLSNGKHVLYARITDKAGQQTILHSDGFVVFTDSAAAESIQYTRNAADSVDAQVELNGNTVASVKNGEALLKEGTDYTISNGKVTFAKNYLEKLAAGTYTLTVSYNPQGETEHTSGDIPVSSTIRLNVIRQETTVNIIGERNKTYDGQPVDLKYSTNSSASGTVEYKVNGTWQSEAPSHVGTYEVKASVPENDDYEAASATDTVTISPKEITVTADNAKKLSNEADPKLTYTAEGLVGNDTLSGIIVKRKAGKKAGTYAISVSQETNANPDYKITFKKGILTIDQADQSKLKGNEVSKLKLPILLAKGKSGKKSITLSWLKYTGADGYEAYWCYCNGSKNYKKFATVKNGKLSTTHKKLKNKREYKYFVAAYKMVEGRKIYIAKSNTLHVALKDANTTNVTSIKVNKSKVNLTTGKTFKLKCTTKVENSKKSLLSHTSAYRYYTSNTKVATVTKNGVIKAKGKGKCTVYVLANNGVYKRIKVTVK